MLFLPYFGCVLLGDLLKAIEFPKLIFFYILTIHNDQKSYVKHVLDPIHVLFTLFGCFDGGKGLGHNLLMLIFYSQQLKNGNIENRFFFIFCAFTMIKYVNHVLDPINLFFSLFGYWTGDGGLLNDFMAS